MRITASNAPTPPGAWLTTPATVAMAKIGRKARKLISVEEGSTNHSPSAASPVSATPSAVTVSPVRAFGRVSDWPARRTGRPPRAIQAERARITPRPSANAACGGRPMRGCRTPGATMRLSPASAAMPSQKNTAP